MNCEMMDSIRQRILNIQNELPPSVTLIAVSKTKPEEMIEDAFEEAGQRHFGENRVQELVRKAENLPADCIWHAIGHLQRNKVKQVIPHVAWIHAVDSHRLLDEVQRRAAESLTAGLREAPVQVLLQVHIAQEEAKFGLTHDECERWVDSGDLESLEGVVVRGLMGMATFTDDERQVGREFKGLRALYERLEKGRSQFDTLSMGMSGDWPIAVDEGSTMIRVGSAIFGARKAPSP